VGVGRGHLLLPLARLLGREPGQFVGDLALWVALRLWPLYAQRRADRGEISKQESHLIRYGIDPGLGVRGDRQPLVPRVRGRGRPFEEALDRATALLITILGQKPHPMVLAAVEAAFGADRHESPRWPDEWPSDVQRRMRLAGQLRERSRVRLKRADAYLARLRDGMGHVLDDVRDVDAAHHRGPRKGPVSVGSLPAAEGRKERDER
jgi:hypothetical protein